MTSARRLTVAAIVLSAAVGIGGAAWERARFGGDLDASRRRIEAEVRTRLDDTAARLRAASDAVARETVLIERAIRDRDAVPELFRHVEDARIPNAPAYAITVYVPDGTGTHRLLAWSEGAAEDLDSQPIAFATDRRSTVVVPGALGLRLIALAPVTSGDRPIALVTAERVLAAESRTAAGRRYRLQTTLGAVALAPATGSTAGPDRLIVSTADGRPLVEVDYEPETLERSRAIFRARVVALALVPLLFVAVAGATRVSLERRFGQSPDTFLGWSTVLALVLLAGGATFLGLLSLAQQPPRIAYLVAGLTAMGIAVALPVSLWWRGTRRSSFERHPIRASVELLLSGIIALTLLAGTSVLIEAQQAAGGSGRLSSPFFPLDTRLLVAHLTRLSLALAVVWTVTSIHAAVVERWRIRWTQPGTAALAIALGCLPAAALGLASVWRPAWSAAAPIAVAVAFASSVGALAAAPLRRRYRRSAQSSKLLMLFGATVLPALLVDPLVWLSARRATESVIERVHAPATAGHAEHLINEMYRATHEIDVMSDLAAFVTRPATESGVTTDAAFQVWSRTVLSSGRLTSGVELYGADGSLTSRFALNVPEVRLDDASAVGNRCEWEVYGEAVNIGADELRMLHAERGICDAAGTIQGAIVLHVIFDYRALPYLTGRNPYDDLLRTGPDPSTGDLGGVDVVVYGWGRLPLFVSGRTAWPIDGALLYRLERSREPFWTELTSDAGRSRVYFLNDRAGIYALAYAVPSAFTQLTRLGETTALAAVVFVVLLAATTFTAPLAGRREAPLRAVVAEVRTSFHRKLFLFFVLTAIIPVGALALTFSAYMGEQLRSDVETEAINAVTVARRVLEDSTALQQPVTDDLLVGIGRVINQDVNVYDGVRLRATSQRDLFDSGVLPERTPARAYRAIVLDRTPTFVEEQRAGEFTYLVAAAPVPGLGRHALISVPLASRQQEIEGEISDLNRGVLFGAVCVILLAAGVGAWVAQRVADPVARLTRATRQIASGRLDVRIVADTADELRRLVTDFNSMAATLQEQRAELGRTHELKAWADMSRQVAHDIKNPLTPVQLAAEHLQRVHEDRQRPLGPVFDQCVSTILNQVKLLRQIASEFSTFAASPVPTLVPVAVGDLLHDVVRPYRPSLSPRLRIEIDVQPGLAPARADRTLLARALTNLVENAFQAMPEGGTLRLTATHANGEVVVDVADEGVGMTADALARAFEPHFSTKTGGTGLGLANAKRNIEACGGTIAAASKPGRGTTMTVRLPVVARDARAGA